MKKLVPLAVFAAFTAFSVVVIVQHGYFGFITLALEKRWALQMLLDLFIALWLVGGWLRRDARARGIAAWPYLALMPFVGSVAALAYLVHRNLAANEVQS